MKFLIVEDEYNVQQYVKRILTHMGFTDIHSADNGQEALYILEAEVIDLVISDIKMPILDGLALLEKIRNTISRDSIFIILSAYDSFENAQKAITYGAFSYLLKPIKDQEFKHTIITAIAVLKERQETHLNADHIQKQYHENRAALTKSLLTKIIVEPRADIETLKNQLNDIEIVFTREMFTPLLISLDKSTVAYTEEHYNVEVILKEVVSAEFPENGINLFTFDYNDGTGLLLNFDAEDAAFSAAQLQISLAKIKRVIETRLHNSISMALGTATDGFRKMHASYTAASHAMARKLVSGNGLYLADTVSSDKRDSFILDFTTEQSMLRCFEKENREGAYALLQEFFSSISETSAINTEKLQNLNYQIVILIFKITKQLRMNPDTILGDEYILYSEVNRLSSIKAMIVWFENVIDSCFTALKELLLHSSDSSIYKAKDIIDSNFSKDISLESVASQIYMSSEHFSREFKKIVGTTYINYLTNLRIEKARQFLTTTHLTITELTSLVGFNDTKYFSKVFKSYTGHTPSKYRKLYALL